MGAAADDEPPRRVVTNFPHVRGGVSEVVMPCLDFLYAAAPGGSGDGARAPRNPKRKKCSEDPAPRRKKRSRDLAPQQKKAIAAMRGKMAERSERRAPQGEEARPTGGAQEAPPCPDAAADWQETLEGLCFAAPGAASSDLNSSGGQTGGVPATARAEEFDARALEQVAELDAFLQAEFARTAEKKSSKATAWALQRFQKPTGFPKC